LLVGSFRDNGKGIDILLKAVKLIEDKVNKVAIAGDGVLKEQMMELRNQLCLKEKVDFLGFRSDIDSLLDQSRIFVLPSRWEGLPISILEAMTKMKPIIATNVGGIPELLENGISGLLVEPENIVMLADAIKKLLNDNELAETIGKKAYKRVLGSYSIDTYVNNIVKVYYKLLNSK
jgi:glycosyltransferase involved in cell wall biosynthesis